MKVIAWDETTDTAVIPERAPEVGEWCLVTHDNGRKVKRQWYEVVEGESEPPPIRIISIGALDERFTFDESVAIEESNNKYVKVLNKRLDRKAYIDLDNPSFESAIDLLISAGIILPERKSDLLANGTEQETYNGVL